MDIGFIGLGKLGLDCAEVFAESYRVLGYDSQPRQSNSVEVVPLHEVVAGSDWIFVAVPTPHAQGYDGSVPSSHLESRDFDYATVRQVLAEINRLATTAKKIVLISTVLPGTTRGQLQHLLDPCHTLLYNPYLIAMGSVKWDMVHPEMVIIGSNTGDDASVAQLIDLYRPLIQAPVRWVTGTWEECEAVKIFYNTFISAKVALVNMIQDFAQRIGHMDVDVVTDALSQSTMRIMGPKYMTAGMGDAGACHPRDNIALRWLAQQHDLGYDIFDTIMLARERQAHNLARFLVDQAQLAGLTTAPIVIHGKAYKPDVPYCVGSYSTLIGHYITQLSHPVVYIDPLADDTSDMISEMTQPCVVLIAHNRSVTYGYTGDHHDDAFYCDIPAGSVLVDPWRHLAPHSKYTVIHYGNTRKQS